jgi:hypothetical protein
VINYGTFSAFFIVIKQINEFDNFISILDVQDLDMKFICSIHFLSYKSIDDSNYTFGFSNENNK